MIIPSVAALGGLDEHLPVSVVIPTFNEEANLPHVLERMPEGIDEVLVVDGHSADRTVEVSKECRPDVRVVYQNGTGKGKRPGLRFCPVDRAIIVMLNGDGSTDPQEIPRFVATLMTGADFVKGSRFITGGDSDDFTPMRRLGSRLLSSVVNVLFDTNSTDLCYGYTAFRRTCLDEFSVDAKGFEVETLMNVRAARAGVRVAEVPSFEKARISGESSFHARRDGLRVLRTIIAECVRPR